jgi:hypothetical protein
MEEEQILSNTWVEVEPLLIVRVFFKVLNPLPMLYVYRFVSNLK